MILLVFIYRPRLSYRLVVFYSLSLLASLVHITCISVELCLCINMSGCLCLSVCLALCLSACLFVCLPLSLFPYQSVYRRSDCPFLYLPALHILIRKAMCTSVYACLCVCLSVCVYVCLTVCLPACPPVFQRRRIRPSPCSLFLPGREVGADSNDREVPGKNY